DYYCQSTDSGESFF
nr:immunoglobulin light chain junction region [Macaca mulatta]